MPLPALWTIKLSAGMACHVGATPAPFEVRTNPLVLAAIVERVVVVLAVNKSPTT